MVEEALPYGYVTRVKAINSFQDQSTAEGAPPAYDRHTQFALIQAWIDDPVDNDHLEPKVFFATHAWDIVVLKTALTRYIKRIAEEMQPPIHRCVRRISAKEQDFKVPITWTDVLNGQKLDWRHLYYNISHVDPWNAAKFMKYLILLRDEVDFLQRTLENIEGYESWLRTERNNGTIHVGERPFALIPARRTTTVPPTAELLPPPASPRPAALGMMNSMEDRFFTMPDEPFPLGADPVLYDEPSSYAEDLPLIRPYPTRPPEDTPPPRLDTPLPQAEKQPPRPGTPSPRPGTPPPRPGTPPPRPSTPRNGLGYPAPP